jgi:hypothetical protein
MFFLGEKKEFFRNQHSVLTAAYRNWYISHGEQRVYKKQRNGSLVALQDASITAWIENYWKMELAVRLLGTDTLDLDLFLEGLGVGVYVSEYPIAENKLNYKEWMCTLMLPQLESAAWGATRHEAIAKALLKVRKNDEVLSLLSSCD